MPAIAPPDNPPPPELELELAVVAAAAADAEVVGFDVVCAEVLLGVEVLLDVALVVDEAAALTTTPSWFKYIVLVVNGVAAVALPVVIRF